MLHGQVTQKKILRQAWLITVCCLFSGTCEKERQCAPAMCNGVESSNEVGPLRTRAFLSPPSSSSVRSISTFTVSKQCTNVCKHGGQENLIAPASKFEGAQALAHTYKLFKFFAKSIVSSSKQLQKSLDRELTSPFFAAKIIASSF